MLDGKIKELAKKRECFETVKTRYELAKQGFEASQDFTLYQIEKKILENLEEQIRQEAVEIFNNTGNKQPHEAVEIKEKVNLNIDEPKALTYAFSNLPDSLSLNRKIFDKVMKALPEEKLPDGVKIEKIPSAYIDTDLSPFLKEE